MRQLRIAFIGCVQFSEAMLGELLLLSDVQLCGVVTRQRSDINADFVDLAGLASEHGVPVFHASGNNQADIAAWIRDLNVDVTFCLGWSYLLKEATLTAAKLGTVGYHPALLPRNRGRHPIIWALVLGLAETGSTFFFMDVGADSGPILSQARVAIGLDDDAGSLYRNLIAVARGQLRRLVSDFCRGAVAGTPQDSSKATYWRKRGPADGCIDWRMPAEAIHNLVRALSPPYPGAHAVFRGTEVKIWKTRVGAAGVRDIEPGYVIDRNGVEILVQCGIGTIVLESHGFDGVVGAPLQRGDYL